MSAEISKVTELDFETIKSNLKDYLRRDDSPFRDWDFEGSGLNYLLDILAYNTHYNAVNAHVSINESFLDSAQIRSNVVSRAKLIGYTPRSTTGARASINIRFLRDVNSSQQTAILPRGAKFTTSFDNSTYNFATLENYQGEYDDSTNQFIFNDVQIVQGEFQTLRFLVDSSNLNQQFLIEDNQIDTNTLLVRVFEHQSTTEAKTFQTHRNFASLDGNSQVYFLSENYEGYYQIEFGDGIIGQKLDNLNVVEISYLRTNGNEANGARVFSYLTSNDDNFENEIDSVSSIELVSRASGGDNRETINEIRKTAPYSFVAQGRGVTINDYEALIRENISNIEALSIWGGEENNPPQYGYVFISAKPKDSLFLSSLQKNSILEFLRSRNLATVTPQIVDPNYTFLFFDIFFRYDQNLTSLSQNQLESRIFERLVEYNDESFETFNRVFRFSRLLDFIDSTDASILNSMARIFAYKRFGILAGNRLPSVVDFKFEIFGTIDQKESMISSSSWLFNNQNLFLADEPIRDNTTSRRLFVYTLENDLETKIRVFNDVGRLFPSEGRLELNSLSTTRDTNIDIVVSPNTYDVVARQNNLLSIDSDRSTIQGQSDRIDQSFKRV